MVETCREMPIGRNLLRDADRAYLEKPAELCVRMWPWGVAIDSKELLHDLGRKHWASPPSEMVAARVTRGIAMRR
jgi:hypothetical protein